MQTFVKIFCGSFASEVEKYINEFAKKRNLTIKSCSITKAIHDVVVIVVFERTLSDVAFDDISNLKDGEQE